MTLTKPMKSMLTRSATCLGAIALTAFTLLCAPARSSAQAELQLGIQTWTLRNLKFEQVVEFAGKHGIKRLQIIGNHFDPMSKPEEFERKKALLDQHGIKTYTFGVAGTSLDKEQNRKLFEFAKRMGMDLIVVEPGDFKILDNLEELVREYDIRIAIHNHGIKSLYGNPAVVRALLKHRDKRMGVCMDAGWITAAGFDAAKVFREYEGRVFDIHLKDKKVEAGLGENVSTDTLIGQGSANLKGLFAELKKSNWKGTLSIETDSPIFAQNPAEFVDGAKKFFETESK